MHVKVVCDLLVRITPRRVCRNDGGISVWRTLRDFCQWRRLGAAQGEGDSRIILACLDMRLHSSCKLFIASNPAWIPIAHSLQSAGRMLHKLEQQEHDPSSCVGRWLKGGKDTLAEFAGLAVEMRAIWGADDLPADLNGRQE